MKTLIICGVICLLLGFFVGRYTMKEGERTTYMKGETIRDTITCFIPDTVRLSEKYVGGRYKRYGLPGCSDRGSGRNAKEYDRGLEFDPGLQEDLVR